MKINVRQICFIFLAYTAVTKLLMYPTILSQLCGRDLLFPAAASFLVEGIVIWAVAYLCSKTDKTFFELLEDTLGNVGARIVFALFALFFFAASVLPVFEQKQYIHNIFYDTVPSLVVFLPFFVFAAYACGKKLTNIGRCADVCFPIFVVTMVSLFIMAFSSVRWEELSPVLKTPITKLLGGFSGMSFHFTAPCWMLMFMGRFKYKKGDAAKLTFAYAGGAAVVLLFLAVFYGVYGAVAPSRTFAVARTSLFFPAIETLGRIDIILLFALEVVMLFATVLNMQMAVQCLAACIGTEKYALISIGINVALAAILIFTDVVYNAIYRAYFNWFWVAAALFTIILPLLAWTLKRRKRA